MSGDVRVDGRLQFGHVCECAAFERQVRLCTAERLNLRFLVAAELPRMVRRIGVQAKDILELLDEARVVEKLEGLYSMRLKPVNARNTRYGRGAGTQVSGQGERLF